MVALLLALLAQIDPGLVERIAADDPADRAAARAEIRKVTDREPLLKALKVRETRRHAAMALGVLGAAEAKDALAALAKDREPAVRAGALEAIGFVPEPPVELLVESLGDVDPRAAFAAGRSLGRGDSKKLQPRLFAITSALIGAKKREVRFLAASLALEGLSPGTQWFTFYTSMSDPDAMYVGAAILGLLQVEKTDPAKTSGVDFTSGFRAALARTDLREDVRGIAATLWLRLGAPSREDLYALAKDREAPTRRVALRALDAAGLTRLDAGALIELLADPDAQKIEELTEWIEAKLAALTSRKAEGANLETRVRDWRAWWEANREGAIAADLARAVERGVDHLRKQVQADGTWKDVHGQAGITALVAYTLMKCGLPPADPLVERALDFAMKAPLEGPPLEGGTYRAAVIAMAAADASSSAGGDAGAKYRKRAHEAAAYLAQSQHKGGAWGYSEKDAPYQDTSNTQFAVLGLRAAQNVGAKVPAAVWSRAASHLSSVQLGDGGWGYTKEQSYGSMTAAGLCGLLIARSSSKGQAVGDFLKDKEVVAALEWLEKNWSLEGHRYRTGGAGSGLGSAYYWLWTLERCALVADVKRFGLHDWWFEGARYVIGRQGKSGEWTGPEGLAAHCFALLFLKRAYVPVATGAPKDD